MASIRIQNKEEIAAFRGQGDYVRQKTKLKSEILGGWDREGGLQM